MSHINPLFARFNILKVADIFDFIVSQYVFQHQELFTATRVKSYLIRAKSNIVHVFQRLLVTQKSVYFTSPLVSNSLPLHIRESRSLATLKELTNEST